LFAMPEVTDVGAALTLSDPFQLAITLRTVAHANGGVIQRAMGQLTKIPVIEGGLKSGELRVQMSRTLDGAPFRGAKRRLEVRAL
ncbi:MAG TPA: hypothetical protein VF786_12545, partial [Terriglobales bacterium]